MTLGFQIGLHREPRARTPHVTDGIGRWSTNPAVLRMLFKAKLTPPISADIIDLSTNLNLIELEVPQEI